MAKSKKYDAISGLEGNTYVFEFTPDDDGSLKLIGIWKDDKILDPDIFEWMTAKDSDECLSAYNIYKNGVAVEA